MEVSDYIEERYLWSFCSGATVYIVVWVLLKICLPHRVTSGSKSEDNTLSSSSQQNEVKEYPNNKDMVTEDDAVLSDMKNQEGKYIDADLAKERLPSEKEKAVMAEIVKDAVVIKDAVIEDTGKSVKIKSEVSRPKTGKTEKEKAEADLDKQAKYNASITEKAKPDRAKTEAAMAEKANTDKVKTDPAMAEKDKADKAKADAALAEKAKVDQAKADALLAEKAKADKAKSDAALAEKDKADKAKVDAAMAEKAKADKAKADAALAEKAKVDEAKVDALQAEKAKAEKSKADAALAEKAKADKVKIETALAEKAKADKLKADAVLAEKAKDDAALAERAKFEKEKSDASAAEKARLDKAKAHATMVDKAKADLAKSDAAKTSAGKLNTSNTAEQTKATTAKSDHIKQDKVPAVAKAYLAKTNSGNFADQKPAAAKPVITNVESGRVDPSKGDKRTVDPAKSNNKEIPKDDGEGKKDYEQMDTHYKCRAKHYDGKDGGADRFAVPDNLVKWEQPFKDYKPVKYTAKNILEEKPFWADPDVSDIAGFAKIKFNQIDGSTDRQSFVGKYEMLDGLPLNPIGRTGITGRGMLGKWGPNHAADPIVTRWKRDEKGQIVRHSGVGKKPILEFVCIQRGDTHEWAIPGGMVDANEEVSLTLKREFNEEALNSLVGTQKEQTKKDIQEVFKNGEVVFKGYVDDPRNTDNAWMETVACNFHDEDGTTVGRIPLSAGDDARAVRWLTIDKPLQLYASHSSFVEAVCTKRGAYFARLTK